MERADDDARMPNDEEMQDQNLDQPTTRRDLAEVRHDFSELRQDFSLLRQDDFEHSLLPCLEDEDIRGGTGLGCPARRQLIYRIISI